MITRFFGDAEHTFGFTRNMIAEIETTTGSGIMALCLRVLRSEFAFADLTETIRCGLIGGGTTPKRAAELTARYTDPALGLVATHVLAVEILTDLHNGPAKIAAGTNGESPSVFDDPDFIQKFESSALAPQQEAPAE